ncbi:MAG: amidohydrolase [Deltaproteobacteria bacterium]|nr:MAG: amidohydrolase [Deltaproteobacteria bacterium]
MAEEKINIEDVKAIDIMNHPGEAGRTPPESPFDFEEFKIMTRTTFKTVFKGIVPPKELMEKVGGFSGHNSTEEMIENMDKYGYDKIVITATKMWSYYWHHRLILDYSIDMVGEIVQEAKGRVIGAASYSPFRIEESLRDIERGVKEYGFKYVWFHPISFGLSPKDPKCYPCYAKCNELGIPVGVQVGHSAEVLPSAVGHPMEMDEVAIDFPNLKINLSHTGWPWVDEWCSMLWRHPNVYGDISAYFPKSLDERLIRFMDGGRGRDKVLFGTNGISLIRCIEEFKQLPIKDKTKKMVLRDNALRFLGIEE